MAEKNGVTAEPETLDRGSGKRLGEMVDVLRRHDVVRGVTPEKLRAILEDLGPTFVKLGQILSVRPDILPEEYGNELVKLQTSVKPLEFDTILAILEKEYSRPWQQIFKVIYDDVLGSASVAQVHRAELLDGSLVAVKVQRPLVYETISQDIQLLRRATTIVKLLGRGDGVIDFDLLLTELWTIAQQEMDFLMEADHIAEFHHLNADAKNITCPQVYRELTTRRVLVMEYIDGIRFDDREALARQGYDIDQLGRRLAENYVKQILEDGFFHADPHPGNIRIKGDRIVWLDLGMMGRLSGKDRGAIKNALLALGNHDAYDMKAAVLSLGVPKGRVNHARLYEDLDDLIGRYGDIDLGQLEMGHLTRQIMTTLRDNHISIGPGLSMFARGTITIEGVLRRSCAAVSFVDVFSRGLELDIQRNFDWKAELSRIKRDGRTLLHKTMLLPEQISDILKMTMSGQTKVNLDLTGSEEPLRRIDAMINKLVMGILGAALLLGSSVISTTQMTPKILEIPLLGVIGYLAALLLCSWLLWRIFKSG